MTHPQFVAVALGWCAIVMLFAMLPQTHVPIGELMATLTEKRVEEPTGIPPVPIATWNPPDDGQPRGYWCAEGCGPFTMGEALHHGRDTGHGHAAPRNPR